MENFIPIEDKSIIRFNLELAVNAWNNMELSVDGNTFNTFIFSITEENLLAFHLPDSLLFQQFVKQKTNFVISFNQVDQGLSYPFRFTSSVVKIGAINNLETVFFDYPEEMQQAENGLPYIYRTQDDEQVKISFEMKHQEYSAEILSISLKDFQLYASPDNKTLRKSLWMGRKIENCVLKLNNETITFDAQLIKTEGAGWNCKFFSIQKPEKEKIISFLRDIFINQSRYEKLNLNHKKNNIGKLEKSKNNNLTALIVDTNEAISLALKFYLEKKNIRTIHALDGDNVLQIAGRIKPQLVLMDTRLQESSGLRICQELKDIIYTKKIPVLITSTFSKEEKLDQAIRAGGLDILRRPFRFDKLYLKMQAALAIHQPDILPQPDDEALKVVIFNRDDDLAAYRIYDWAITHKMEISVKDTFKAFLTGIIQENAAIGMLNINSIRTQLLVEKCLEFKSILAARKMPVFIASPDIEVGKVKHVQSFVYLTHSYTPTLLNSVTNLLQKLHDPARLEAV